MDKDRKRSAAAASLFGGRKRKTVKRYGITDNDHESDLARRRKEQNQVRHLLGMKHPRTTTAPASVAVPVPVAPPRKKPPAPTVLMTRKQKRGKEGKPQPNNTNNKTAPLVAALASVPAPSQKPPVPTVFVVRKKGPLNEDDMYKAWTKVKAFMENVASESQNAKSLQKTAFLSDDKVQWMCDMFRPFPRLPTQQFHLGGDTDGIRLYTPLLFLLEHQASLVAIQAFCREFPQVVQSYSQRLTLFHSHADILQRVQPAIRDFLQRTLPRRVPPQDMEAAMEGIGNNPTEYTLDDLKLSATLERQAGFIRLDNKKGQERLLRAAIYHRVYEHHPEIMDYILDQYGTDLRSFSVDSNPPIASSLSLEMDNRGRLRSNSTRRTTIMTMDLNGTVAQLVQRLPCLVNLQVEVTWTITDRQSWGNLLQTIVTASPSLESLSLSFWPAKKRTGGPGRPPSETSVLPSRRVPQWVWGVLYNQLILGSMPHLKHLALERNEALDHGSKEDGITKALKQLLERNSQLEGLFVNHFHMDHHVIIKALSEENSLKYFGIDKCSDTEEKEAALLDMLRSNTRLHNVVLPQPSSPSCTSTTTSTARTKIAHLCVLNQIGRRVASDILTPPPTIVDLLYTKVLNAEHFPNRDSVLQEPECVYRGPRENMQPSDLGVPDARTRLSYSYSLLRACPSTWSNSRPMTGVQALPYYGETAPIKAVSSLPAKKSQSSSSVDDDFRRLITPQSTVPTRKKKKNKK